MAENREETHRDGGTMRSGRQEKDDGHFFNDFLVPFESKLTKIRTKEY